MALRNLLVRVGSDITGLKKGLQNAQKDVKYFGRNVTGSLKEIQGTIAKTTALFSGGLLITKGVQDAMRFEALMTTLGETLGQSRHEFEKWQKSVGTSMGFSMLQSAELANMLSLNFKTIASSTDDLVKKTTDMMELAAVISNKRGMTMTEVSDRIRSAMNQEADGAMELGVDVRIAAIKAGKAYQEMANGEPWDKLSEHMRKTILYHHIFEQVNKNLGLTMQDTTAMRMAQFTAVLADVRMALGQAFLPILYNVLPILTKLATALYKVIQVVAAFTRSLFGGFKYKPPVSKGDVDTTKEQAKALDGVGSAAETAGKKQASAAKKAQKAWSGTFGFDEVHTIKDPEASTGGAGGGGGGGAGGLGGLGGASMEMPTMDTLPFEETISEIVGKMDKITKPIREIFSKVWTEISGFAIEKFNQISAWWDEHGAQITQAIQNVWSILKPIIMMVVEFVWESIKGLIDGVIQFFQGLIEFFTGVFTGDWALAWEGIKNMFFGALKAIWNFLNLTFIGGIRKAIANFVVNGLKLIKSFADDFVKFFRNSWTNIKKIFSDLVGNIKKMIKDIKDWWVDFCMYLALRWELFVKGIKTAAKNAWEGIKSVFSGAAEWFARVIITPIINKFNEIKDAFKENLTAGFTAVLNTVRNPLNNMIDAVNSVKSKIPIAKNLPDIPRIPKLARGGITNGPTLAVVGDNVGGREVISPLDRLQSMLTTSVLQAMQFGGGGGNANSGDIILNIDGRSFARVVKPFIDREQSRVGNDVRIRTI